MIPQVKARILTSSSLAVCVLSVPLLRIPRLPAGGAARGFRPSAVQLFSSILQEFDARLPAQEMPLPRCMPIIAIFVRG